MALTDLTGTKWRFNETIDLTTTGVTPVVDGREHFVYLSFTSNENTYAEIFLGSTKGVAWNILQYNADIVYSFGQWTDQAYRLIEITGGTDATNANLISWIQANAEQVIDPSKLLKSGTSVIGKINGHYVSSVNGTNVMSGIVANTPTGYDVTITFQNTTGTGAWLYTNIFDDYDDTSFDIPTTATQIGSISSANGSTTVTTNTGKLAIFGKSQGVYTGFTPSVTGGVSYVGAGNEYGLDYGLVRVFSVTGNGTITIDGADWDD